MKAGIFLDRDGTIIELIRNPDTREYEPPRSERDVKFCDGAVEALQTLWNAGFELFLVSNQPDFAKGKAQTEQLREVHQKFDTLLRFHGIYFREYYYCYHHPDGVVPIYSGECMCRKPGYLFLNKARDRHDINLTESWMIGDRDTDAQCGINAGTKTILIMNGHTAKYRGAVLPDHLVKDLGEVVKIIMEEKT